MMMMMAGVERRGGGRGRHGLAVGLVGLVAVLLLCLVEESAAQNHVAYTQRGQDLIREAVEAHVVREEARRNLTVAEQKHSEAVGRENIARHIMSRNWHNFDRARRVLPGFLARVRLLEPPVRNSTKCIDEKEAAINKMTLELTGKIEPEILKMRTALDFARGQVSHNRRIAQKHKQRMDDIKQKYDAQECMGPITQPPDANNAADQQANAPPTGIPPPPPPGTPGAPATLLLDLDESAAEARAMRATVEPHENADVGVAGAKPITLIAERPTMQQQQEADQRQRRDAQRDANVQAANEAEQVRQRREAQAEAERAAAAEKRKLILEQNARGKAEEQIGRNQEQRAVARAMDAENGPARRQREQEEEARRQAQAEEHRRISKRRACKKLRERYQDWNTRYEKRKTTGETLEARVGEIQAQSDKLHKERDAQNVKVDEFKKTLDTCRASNQAALRKYEFARDRLRHAKRVTAQRKELYQLSFQNHQATVEAELVARRIMENTRAIFEEKERIYKEKKAAATPDWEAYHLADLVDTKRDRNGPLAIADEGYWDEKTGQQSLQAISLNEWNELFAVTKDRTIEHYAPESNSRHWLFLPGGQASVGVLVDCKGDIWKLQASGDILFMEDKNVWKVLPVKNRRKPVVVSFSGSSIENLWVVSDAGIVYRYDPASQLYVRQHQGTQRMRKISVSCEGDMWAIGKDRPVLYHYLRAGSANTHVFNWKTHTYTDLTDTWVVKGNNIRDVDVGKNGPFAVSTDHTLVQYFPDVNTGTVKTEQRASHWHKYQQPVSMVAVGNDNSLYALTAAHAELIQYQTRERLLPEGEIQYHELVRHGVWQTMDGDFATDRITGVYSGKDNRVFALAKNPSNVLQFNLNTATWGVIPESDMISISRACDGTTAAVTAANDLVGWDKPTGKWTEPAVPKKLRAVAVCNKEVSFGIDLDGDLFMYNYMLHRWVNVNPGQTNGVVVDNTGMKRPAKRPEIVRVDCNCDDKVIVLDATGQLYLGGLRPGGVIFKAATKGVKDAAIADEIYVIDSRLRLYQYNALPHLGNWGPNSQWKSLHMRLRQISANGEGQLFGLDYFNEPVRFVESTILPSWVFINGLLRKVHVANQQVIYGETPKGQLMKLMKNAGEEDWIQVTNAPSFDTLTVGCDGTLIGVSGKHHRIFLLDGGSESLANPNAEGQVDAVWRDLRLAENTEITQVAAADKNTIYGIDRDGTVFFYQQQREEWLELMIPTKFLKLAVTCDGVMWGIGDGASTVYRKEPEKNSWELMVNQTVRDITAGTHVYVLDEERRMYRYEPERLVGQWVSLLGIPVYDFSAGGDEAVYAIDLFDRVVEINEGRAPRDTDDVGRPRLSPNDGTPAASVTSSDTTDNGIAATTPEPDSPITTTPDFSVQYA